MKQHVPTWYVVVVRHFNNNFVRMRLRTSNTANNNDKTNRISAAL
jgi:hypothetical protein